VRVGLEFCLSKENEIEIVFSVSNIKELLDSLKKKLIDVLILDLNLEDSKGLNTLSIIHSSFPQLKILVLSSEREGEYAVKALKKGAMGYLEKAIFSKEIVKAIKYIVDGKKYITDKVSNVLLNEDSFQTIKIEIKKLSKREKEILTFLCQGISSKEIASNLSISQKTVYTYKKRIMEKLNIDYSQQLMKFIYENNICQDM